MTQMNKKLLVENKDLKSKMERSLTNKIEGMINKHQEEVKDPLKDEELQKLTSQNQE